jgi:hypothetical protein
MSKAIEKSDHYFGDSGKDYFMEKFDGRLTAGRLFQSNYLFFTWSPANFGNLMTEAGFSVRDVRLSKQAWSPRIFFVQKMFGDAAFRLACRVYSSLSQRREIVCTATKGVQ